mgnify:CR=1 FL=1
MSNQLLSRQDNFAVKEIDDWLLLEGVKADSGIQLDTDRFEKIVENTIENRNREKTSTVTRKDKHNIAWIKNSGTIPWYLKKMYLSNIKH